MGTCLDRLRNDDDQFVYISEAGVAQPVEPMDFAAWFEAYLEGEWHTLITSYWARST